MAARETIGVTTRQMLKKMNSGEGGSGASGVALGATAAACDHSCRTFPLEHGEQQLSSGENVGKRQPRTETASKQKRTLIERNRNAGQGQRKTNRTSDVRNKTDASKVNTTKTCKGLKKYESTDMAVALLNAKRCLVMDPPMETTLTATPSTGMASSGQHPHIPPDVVDIDDRWDDLIPSTYSRDIMDHWRRLETQCAMSPGFLDSSPEVTPRMRAVLMDWLLQVQEHEELEDETLHVCRVLIDRILARGGIVMAYLQLVGITCLLVASKFCERFCTEIKTLCYLTDKTYTEDNVIAYEKKVLVTLDWDITRPVCTHFLDRFLQVHQHSMELRQLAMYLVDLSITSVKLACVLPSKLAAGALLLARRLVMTPAGLGHHVEMVGKSSGLGDDGPWTRALQFYTGYAEADLWAELEEMDAMLVKAPTSKFQGARKKYNTKARCYISTDPRLYVTSLETLDRDGDKPLRPS